MSNCERCVVGNEARRLALSWNAGLLQYRDREGVRGFAPPICGAAPIRPGIAKRADLDKPPAGLVHDEISVLGCDDQFLHAYSQVGPVLSAMRLSRSWEEGLWHAS
jgi:hypothetical protein